MAFLYFLWLQPAVLPMTARRGGFRLPCPCSASGSQRLEQRLPFGAYRQVPVA